MKIAPPSQLTAHTGTRRGSGRTELLMRYAAAYTCTLIAVAAAQLYVPNPFALLLAAITLLGLPISLYLRWSDLRIFGQSISRFVINSLVVVVTCIACFALLVFTQGNLFARGLYQTVMLSNSTTDAMGILMSMILIFAVTRSLAIINDKEAMLCAVPSFSVLLLLIVVHRGPAVVAYFLMWALVAAVLFALDHRQEAQYSVGGVIPSLEPGQDVKLSARGLTTVMSFSLICAIAISYWLSSRNPDDRGVVEGWILDMAGRMTQLALNIPDVSVNSGPERQIDFTSGPALPTRTELWNVHALTNVHSPTSERRHVQPEYWRMFALTEYNGSTWSQTPGSGTPIRLERLDFEQWPITRQQNSPGFSQGPGFQFNPGPRTNIPRPDSAPGDPPRPRRLGYDILGRHPDGDENIRSFGNDLRWILQIIEPRAANVGFVPILPTARAVRISGERPPNTIRVRDGATIEAGVLEAGQQLFALSSVSSDPKYGLRTNGGGPPTRKGEQFDASVVLSPEIRRANLKLPEKLLAPESRVKQLAEEVLRSSSPDESDYARARRLSLMLQDRAIYTLRPPAIPENIDAAEYFLFQSQRGYCTYFAGALTVLCRTVGIPARVVSGFVNPEWVEGGQTGILREANAHAWTEVWVEGWGWAAVDATPPDNRGNNAPDWWENWTDLLGATLDSTQQWLRANTILVFLSTLILLPILLFAAVRLGAADSILARLQNSTRGRIQLNQDQSRRVIFKSYARAARKLARRFRARTPWETPSEWLRAAEISLELESPQPLRELTQLYLQAKYSPREIHSEHGATAVELMQRLSWRTRKT